MTGAEHPDEMVRAAVAAFTPRGQMTVEESDNALADALLTIVDALRTKLTVEHMAQLGEVLSHLGVQLAPDYVKALRILGDALEKLIRSENDN